MRRSTVRQLREAYEEQASAVEEQYPLQPLRDGQSFEDFLAMQADVGVARVTALAQAIPAYAAAWVREARMRRIFGIAFAVLLGATALLLLFPSGVGALLATLLGGLSLLALIYLTFYERAVGTQAHRSKRLRPFSFQEAVTEDILKELQLRYPTL